MCLNPEKARQLNELHTVGKVCSLSGDQAAEQYILMAGAPLHGTTPIMVEELYRRELAMAGQEVMHSSDLSLERAADTIGPGHPLYYRTVIP
jgi:hypothetical protein